MASNNKAVRIAVMAILNGDSTLTTLLGSSGRIMRFQPIGKEQAPVLTYYLYDSMPGQQQRHDVFIQFDAWTTAATGALGKGDDILERVEILLVPGNFQAQSVDAYAWRMRGPLDTPTGMDVIFRQTVDYRIHVN